ncbi:MAG: VanZ family protein [Leptolyngbyaceae cyanobacterium bins.349]|nr:VanZ family protein [Leptolyngbyaceae cyanobacterium bins.349]
MSDRRSSRAASAIPELATAWSVRIVLLAVVVIVVSTLYPFKFTPPEQSPLEAVLQNLSNRSSYLDVAANIVLFAPLGFGLASGLAKRRFSWFTKLLAVTIICGGFSLLIEILQAFLPSRHLTPLDVVSNALGGTVGFLIFQFMGHLLYPIATQIRQWVHHQLSRVTLKYLVAMLMLYITLAGWMVMSWQGASLSSWNAAFPLSIGHPSATSTASSEQEANPAWTGSVADVVLSDRALAGSQVEQFFAEIQTFPPQAGSIVAAYSLRGQDGHKDLIGQSPDLVWQGQPATMNRDRGALVGADHWLQTAGPLSEVTNRIRRSSQFTLSALIHPQEAAHSAAPFQQIMAMATPGGFGNFAVSQVGSSLNFLVLVQRANRSNRPNRQSVIDVFQDQNPHRFVITYSGFVTRIYVDGPERAYILDMTPNRFQIMLYLLVLLPLAFLIGLIANRVRHHLEVYLVVVGLGTVLPALMLEGFLAGEGDRTIRLANLLLGMLIMSGTILALKGNFKTSRSVVAANS